MVSGIYRNNLIYLIFINTHNEMSVKQLPLVYIYYRDSNIVLE